MGWRSTVLILLCLGACGDEAPALEGRSFLLRSGYTPVAGTTVQLSFHDGELGASAGCNAMFGAYQLRDGALVVSELGSTTKGCKNEYGQQDRLVGEFLTSQPKLVLEDKELTLTGPSSTWVFLDEEVANPDRPLQGTVWSIDTFIEGDFATSYAKVKPSTLTFAADGSFTLQGPCNLIGGKYNANDRITISELDVTQAACPDVDGGKAESHLLAVFAQGAKLTYEIDADKLRIMNGDKGVMADAP